MPTLISELKATWCYLDRSVYIPPEVMGMLIRCPKGYALQLDYWDKNYVFWRVAYD